MVVWRKLSGRSVIRKLVAFGAVGITAALTYSGVFLLLIQLGALPVLAINAVAFGASAACSYVGHYQLTFQATSAHSVSVPKFLVLCAAGYLITNGIVLSCQTLHLPPEMVIIGSVVAMPIVNFIAMQAWVFADRIRRA